VETINALRAIGLSTSVFKDKKGNLLQLPKIVRKIGLAAKKKNLGTAEMMKLFTIIRIRFRQQNIFIWSARPNEHLEGIQPTRAKKTYGTTSSKKNDLY